MNKYLQPYLNWNKLIKGILISWKKRRFLHERGTQLPKDRPGKLTRQQFHCSGCTNMASVTQCENAS